jgi:hypothetical protein
MPLNTFSIKLAAFRTQVTRQVKITFYLSALHTVERSLKLMQPFIACYNSLYFYINNNMAPQHAYLMNPWYNFLTFLVSGFCNFNM